jgi:hypothetical protein
MKTGDTIVLRPGAGYFLDSIHIIIFDDIVFYLNNFFFFVALRQSKDYELVIFTTAGRMVNRIERVVSPL